MQKQQVAEKLVDLAGSVVAGDTEEKTITEAAPNKYAAYRDLREAQAIVAHSTGRKLKMAAAPRVEISKLPGMAGMQVRAAINQIVSVRQEAEVLRRQFESELQKLKDLDAEEKKGLEALKDAAAQVKQKERYLIEAEQGLLEFTAFTQEKRPGVAQMIGDPTASPMGDKAGAFFQRVAEKLGAQVAESVQACYNETVEDLTHTADAIRGLKVVAKTASIKESTLKKAGIADVAVSIREWLGGAVDNVSKRILNFAGNIKKWLKGFQVRTKIVKSNKDNLLKALTNAQKQIDDALAKATA